MASNLGYNDHDEGMEPHPIVTPSDVKPPLTAGDTTKTQAERAKQEKRKRTPLLYCKLITSWPKLSFGKLTFI